MDNINNNYIVTDLYIKPTDQHIYVEFRSSHPTIVKKKKKKEKEYNFYYPVIEKTVGTIYWLCYIGQENTKKNHQKEEEKRKIQKVQRWDSKYR